MLNLNELEKRRLEISKRMQLMREGKLSRLELKRLEIDLDDLERDYDKLNWSTKLCAK